MKTLTIEIPNGYEIDSFDKLSGKIQFKEKPKNVMERIKSIPDILSDNKLTQAEFDFQCKGLSSDEVSYRILKVLVSSLNEGWIPDWNDSNQYKYFPWFYMGGPSGFRFFDYAYWCTHSIIGSRLCFKTSELAKYAGKKFASLYKQFMILK